MTESELFQEGINLMFSGMGFVIIFLLILIFAITGISKIITKLFPETTPIIPPNKPISATLTATNEVDKLLPIIVAAIAHHRRQQGLN
ncbi:oxaloacetate decarboxylase subunit gamma [Mannheimia massilioguelmaensis]|uniref:oxaloacetate decarboxylase subunit gamma n=1 Tax=Mannheimia massilioguelmaensis TaxID=1604354 RepID=UPI0005C99495|nr:oxaloacetate decarboxylase subunit gamma [Mannheimia massilioguelmaensis]